MLSAFAVDTALVLAHIEIDEKSNEVRQAQAGAVQPVKDRPG
jgi:hypothetical protein